jgi:hypothetical protein
MNDQERRKGEKQLLKVARDCLFYFAFRVEWVEFDGFRFHEGPIASNSSVMDGFDRVAEHHESDGVMETI